MTAIGFDRQAIAAVCHVERIRHGRLTTTCVYSSLLGHQRLGWWRDLVSYQDASVYSAEDLPHELDGLAVFEIGAVNRLATDCHSEKTGAINVPNIVGRGRSGNAWRTGGEPTAA